MMKDSGNRAEEKAGEGPGRIVDKEAFLFLLDYEVKRARRYQNFISLLLMRLTPANGDDSRDFNACYRILKSVLMEEMRETDILGTLAENELAALLPYADTLAGEHAKSRFENNLKDYDFKSKGYEVNVRQFCFPQNGTATGDLIRKALGEERS